MANKNLLLQSPTAGDIEEIFSQGADALTSAPVAAPVAAQGLPPQTQPAARTPAPAAAAAPSRAAPTRDDIIRRARELDIDPAVPLAIWGIESGSNFNSRDSYKGAVGGMQVMPDTYKSMMGSYAGQRDPWNNLEAGLRYIAYGQKTLGSRDPALLAAGYHAGYDRKDLKAGQIPQGIGDGLMKTSDYAASVARKVGLGSGDLQAKLNKEDPGRYKVLTPAEAQDIERKQLQGTLDAEEPGRFKVLTDDDLAKLPASASVPSGVDDGTPKEVGFWGRLPQVAQNGWQNMTGALDVSRAVLSDDFTPSTINTISTNLENQIRRSVADAGRQHSSERELKQAIEDFGKTKGWGDTTKGVFSLLGTAAMNPKGVAIGTVEQIANMLPSVGGALGGAATGAGVGAAAGSVIPGAGTAAGAATGALWGSRAGLMAGTAALEFGNEITEAITSRLAEKNLPPTRENIAELLSDPAVQSEVKAQAAKKGLTLAAVDALSMGLAGKVGSKGVQAAASGAKGKAAAYGAGAFGVELAGEPIGEAASQMAARGQIDKADVAAEAIYGAGSAAGGAAMGTAGQVVRDRVSGKSAPAPAAAPAAAPAGPRQEPTIDVTYTDAQGNTVTETVPGASTATPAAPSAPTGPIGRALEKGGAVPVAQPAPEAAAPAAPAQSEPVDMPRVRITAENGQTMTGFAERLGPDGSGRVIGDDGQVYQFTPADGVTIEQIEQPAAPDAQEAAAAAEPAPAAPETATETEAATADAAKADAEKQEDAKAPATVEPEAAAAPAPAALEAPAQEAARPLTEWSEQELRDRLRYVTEQAKANGGWDGRLTKERGRISREINSRNAAERRSTEAKNDQQPAANPVPDGNVAPGGDQAAAPVQRDQSARSAAAEKPDVRADAGQERARAPELPVRTDVPGADAAADTQPALSDGQRTDSLGRTASWVIREKDTGNVVMETFDKKKVDALNTGKYEAVPVQQHLGELNQSIKAAQPDAHAGKWFGSQEKADDYLTRKNAGTTHEVVKTGKVRWEIKPKAQVVESAQNATPAGVNQQPEATETVAENTQNTQAQAQGESAANADLDAMFDNAVAAKKQADAQAAPVAPKAKKPRSPAAKKAVPAKTEAAKAAESLTSAAKNTAAGLTAAIDGLGELFGGAGKLNSGLTFDEETYAKAKPLFKQAISHLGDAGSDLRQAMQAIVNMVMDKFGADVTQRMKPYVVRFVADVRDGKEVTGQAPAESGQAAEAAPVDAKSRVESLRAKVPAPKKGQPGIVMEPAVASGGTEAIRFHVVDAKGEKIGKTQMVRAATPDAELVPLMQRLLDDTLAQGAKFNQPKAAPSDVVRGKGESNAASATRGVEQRGGQPAAESILAEGDGDATGGVRQRDSDGGRAGRGQDQGQQGDPGVSPDSTPAHGDGSFVGVHRGDGAAEFAAVASGSEFRERGSGIGDAGVPAEPYAAEAARAAADSPAKQRERQRAQRAADGVKSAPGIDNIRATLPALLPAQQDDVAKTEARFSKPDGYGMLLTNGTGTGKTYSGLGVAKRFYRDGKQNILIVVPDEKVASDWVDSAGDVLMDAAMLPDTQSAGDGVVVTTYANLGQNNALASRAWDLVIADEAHKLMQGSKGEATAALDNLRAVTMHPDGAYTRYQMQNAGDIATLQTLIAQQKENAKPDDALAAKIDALEAKLSDARKKVQAEVDASQGEKRPRAMFLSATPFAYEKAVDWAQGYLFEYPKAEGTGYNSGNGQQRFMMQHFGYTMRYNKLTEPDSKVDRGLMQRNFNTWLKREGALSGRVLDVDADYDRRFVLIDSNVGNRIDEAFSWLDGQRREATGEDGRVWQAMSQSLNDAFDYLSRRYLLEAIKAKESIPYVKGQLARDRKVVVFHDYKKGGGFNPFAAFARMEAPANLSSSEAAKFRAGLDRFRAEFGDLVAADWDSLGSAVSTYSEAFGNKLLVVNGDQKPRDNLARYKRFQDDASGPQVILVQSAKNAGWSGHDTTGKHQRVLLNLGLPTAPIMAIQQEGRIYRTGQASDAIMRYMNTGTSWEKTAFAATIAGRASTAENLGMGEDARALKDSFIAAFEESDAYPPGHEGEGTGGKERDRSANSALTEYDRAKAYYWATQKKSSKTKAQEGKDYFATPEPLGQKMVEWADPRGGDKALEPSAGHGAIARWFGENVERTVVEPSTELRSRLSLVIDPANDRIVAADFEDLAQSNKYDVIAMNPPFGTAGRTAIDHLAKAAQHLRDRGRVVSIIPTGPAADKKFDAWLYEQNDKGQSMHGDLHLVADIKLPQSAFERAGTSVAARVVVIDKVADADAAPRQTRNIDLSDAKDITEFFDRLENIGIPQRAVVEQTQAEEGPTRAETPNRGDATTERQDGDVPTEHTTGKGKTLRGVVRHGVTQDQAKAIDPYTFKKDGGWFIREKYLAEAAPKYSIAPGIDREQSVPVASIESFDVAPEELYARANEWFRENLTGVKVHNDSLGADVSFSKMGRGKVTSVGRRDPRRMSVVQALPELVKNGVLVEEEGDRKGRDGLDGYATLVAPVEIDGSTYVVTIKLRQEGRKTDPATIFYTVAAYNLGQKDGTSRASTTQQGQDRPSTGSTQRPGYAGDVDTQGAPADAPAPSSGVTIGELLNAINESNRAFSLTASPAVNGIVMSDSDDGNAIDADGLKKSLTAGKFGSVFNQLLESGSVVLHDTASSLPGDSHPVGVQAVTMPDGKIHLVASALTPASAQAVLLHEAFHGGVDKLIGAATWDVLMKRLGAIHRQAAQSSGRAREFYDAARRSVANAQRTGTLPESLTAEEFGAYTIEHYEQAPAAFRKWVDDVIGAVKAWLLRRFGLQAGQVTPAQLRALAVAALRDGVGRQDGPRYSVNDQQKAQAVDAASKSLDDAPKQDRIGRVVNDVGLGARLFVHPRTIAAIHPEFTPVYTTAISQMETRDKHIAELGRGVQSYNTLTTEQKANVNKVLELGRLVSETYDAKALADGVANTGSKKTVRTGANGKPRVYNEPIHAALTEAGEVVQLSDAEIKAYLDLRGMFDQALDKFRDQTLVEFGFPELAGQTNPGATLDKMAEGAKNDAERERFQNIANFIREIEQAKRTGYVPFARYGDYVVTVKEKTADLEFEADGDDAYMVRGVPADWEADMLALGALPEGDGWLVPKKNRSAVARLAEKTVYSAKVETGLSDFMEKAKGAEKVDELPSVKAAIEQARKEWVGDDPNRRIVAFRVRDKAPESQVKMTDVDALAEIANIDNTTWDAVRDKLATAIQGRSFRKHFFHSDNVPGYTGDFERAIADYVIGMSGYLSRRAHMKRWDNAVNGISDKGKLHQYATKYRNYVNEPQEEFAAVRQIGFFSYIAGVMATAFANLTQVPLLTVPTLSQVAPAPLVMRELTRAYKDAFAMLSRKQGLDLFDPKKAPEDVRAALMEAWDEGAFVPLESFDMMMTARQRNVGRRKLVKGFNDATKAISIAFTFAERLNRLVTFMAAARLAEKDGIRKNADARLSNDSLASSTVLGRNWTPKNFAEWAVDESQYRMGKANRPTTMRGVGSAIMQFKGFMLQTFEAWYRMAALHGTEGKYAAAASLVALYAMAGLWGMPGADDLRKLIEAAYKAITDKDLDLKTELRGWVARTSGSNVLAQAVTKGASYPLGVDLTRVGMGTVAPDSALAAAGIPFDMLIGRPKRAFEKASAGDYPGAAAEFSPNFIKHWLVAGGWALDGVRDKSGQRIMGADQLSKTDIAMKTMGFQPSIVTDVRDYEYAQRRQETAVDALKRKYASQIARTLVGMERAEEAGDRKKADKLNAELDETYAKLDEHNATAKPEAQIKIDMRSVRQRMQRERDGVMTTWGKERKSAREGAEDLRDLFGLSGKQGKDEGK